MVDRVSPSPWTASVLLVALCTTGLVAQRTSSREPPAQAVRSVPKTSWGHPDLQGIWDQTTGTPLERPDEYKGRTLLTEVEAAERERLRFAEFDEDGRAGGTGDYGSVWREQSKNALNRTALITELEDGRIPPLTPAGRRDLETRTTARRARGEADSWHDRSLWERCITRGLPESMLPGPYNSNLQILQTADYVVLLTEMIHDARIVPLDGRPHPRGVTQWMGVSRGRWEDTTLIVETTNFSAQSNYRGAAAGLHLVERFRRLDADTLDYRVTVTDPTTWKSPWTMTLPMVKSQGLVYEYACHEGNYGLRNMLTVARAADGDAGTGAAPKND